MKNLPPAYFALVMATGIVSIAGWDFELRALAVGLFAFNLAAYAVLAALTVLRAVLYPRLFFGDMTDHRVGPGFFTTVAGSCVLGTQLLLIAHSLAAAISLLFVGISLWIGLTYTIFTAFTVRRDKPRLEEGLSGAWLIAIVATQSVAVLATLVARHVPQPHRIELNFLALSMWLWGGMFYIWIISLIFYRYSFLAFQPGDLTPPYWINMGAMAISTLAGALLIGSAPGDPLLRQLTPFLKGLTLLFWATGSWWIPLLLILGVWRYLIKRFPFEYDPLYWGMVFPIGMYTVCTDELASVMNLPFLRPIPDSFMYLSLFAWVATFLAWLSQALLPTCIAMISTRAGPAAK